MSNKTVILKDKDGNNIYPKVPYTNVFGIPHPINEDINIFYGDGVPTSAQSDYENVKVDDLYIDRNKTYALCIYRCGSVSNNYVYWRATESDIKNAGEPSTSIPSFSSLFKTDLKVGITYTDTNTGDIYVLTEIHGSTLTLTWTKVNSKQSWETINTITIDDDYNTYWKNIFDNSNNVYKKIRVNIYISFTESVSIPDTQGGWVIGVDSLWKYSSTVTPKGTVSTNHYLAEAIIDFENHTITQFVQKGYAMATNTEMFIDSLADKKGFIQIYSLFPAVIDNGTITIEGIKY